MTNQPFARTGSPSFYRCPGPLPPKSWREGLPHGDEGGGRVHDKGKGHGRGSWQETASPKLEKPPSSQDGGPALQQLGVSPMVTSPLERSGRRSP